jgi:phosphopantetheinyl transferase (holo-ACP synthase)
MAVFSCDRRQAQSGGHCPDNEPRVHREIASVSISEVHDHRAELLDRCFSVDERVHLADATDQTVAGLLAVKRAWVALALSLNAEAAPVDLSERDVALTHAVGGAPMIGCHNAPWVRGPLFISVSHTRTTAHGVVCTQQ